MYFNRREDNFMYDIEKIKEILLLISKRIDININYFTELDTLSGDGDFGITLSKIAFVIRGTIDNYHSDDIGMLLKKIALSINKSAPSTMGTLISASVLSLAKEFEESTEISEKQISLIPQKMAQTIQEKGKAEIGEKTVLDALAPMGEAAAAEFLLSGNLKFSIKKAAEAAIKGAEGTKGMIAKAGRAQWIGERAKSNPDPGAMLCAKIAELFL